MSQNSPCAACKFLRRKCTQECVFAPYFPPDHPTKFASVHRVFGASNVAKLLNELPSSQREDAVNSLAYEADARLRDPVYGCVGLISILQHKLKQLHIDLHTAKHEIAKYMGSGIHGPLHQSIMLPMMGSVPNTHQQQVDEQFDRHQKMYEAAETSTVCVSQQRQQQFEQLQMQSQQEVMRIMEGGCESVTANGLNEGIWPISAVSPPLLEMGNIIGREYNVEVKPNVYIQSQQHMQVEELQQHSTRKAQVGNSEEGRSIGH
ncbi:LOB domain-containing protein 36 [Linum perenne]